MTTLANEDETTSLPLSFLTMKHGGPPLGGNNPSRLGSQVPAVRFGSSSGALSAGAPGERG